VTPDQIKQYLQNLKRSSLWENLQTQPELLALVDKPLFLTILVAAYQGQAIHTTVDLLNVYIQKQLHDSNNQGIYPQGKAPSPQQTQYYLSWLAHRLESEQNTEFLIEQLQPSWLESQESKKQYRWITGVITGLSVGLSVGLGVGFINGQFGGVFGGLRFGLSVGLFSGLRVGLFDMEPAEKLTWSWEQARREILYFGLIFGLGFGLIYGLILGDFIFGLSLGLIAGLSIGLLRGVIPVQTDIELKEKSNQGINQSLQNGLIFTLGIGLRMGLLFGLIFGSLLGLIFGLIVGPLLGLILGLNVGLGAAIQHFCLRLTLYQTGSSPWNYEKFLDHAAKHRFIQRVGGHYRFMHDLLRKEFAQMYRQSLGED
jgi:MFS family permease